MITLNSRTFEAIFTNSDGQQITVIKPPIRCIFSTAYLPETIVGEASFQFYNLSRSTFEEINKTNGNKFNTLTLTAGYAGQAQTLVFHGQYFAGNYHRIGTDILYEISGYNTIGNSSPTTINLPATTTRSTAINSVISMSGLVAGVIDIDKPTDQIGSPISITNTPYQIAQSLARILGVTFSILGGRINVYSLSKTREGNVYNVNANNGLLGIPSFVFSGAYGYTGVQFDAKINPNLFLGNVITLTSKYSNFEVDQVQFVNEPIVRPLSDTKLRLHTVRLVGDSRGGSFTWRSTCIGTFLRN